MAGVCKQITGSANTKSVQAALCSGRGRGTGLMKVRRGEADGVLSPSDDVLLWFVAVVGLVVCYGGLVFQSF